MDIRQQITDDIIKAMEAGPPPWRQGWKSGALQMNASTHQTYLGINQLLLGMQPFTDPRWMTYRQATQMKLQVRRGERGTRVVKLVEVDRENKPHAKEADAEVVGEDGRKVLVMRTYTVFNAQQVDGIAPLPASDLTIKPAEAVESIMTGLQSDKGGKLKLKFGGNQPAYYPLLDEIRIPHASAFETLEAYQSTLMHEAIHATGHVKRLGRLHIAARFGSPEYAREELVAELGSAMLLATLGLSLSSNCIESHAAYLSSWLEILKQDKTEIFRAAGQAQKACEHLNALTVEAANQLTRAGAEANADPADSTAAVADNCFAEKNRASIPTMRM